MAESPPSESPPPESLPPESLPPGFLTPGALDGRILMQTLVLPDPAICSESDLFFHRDPGVAASYRRGVLNFRREARLWTDSYMNLLNLGTWTRNGRLHGLALRLAGRGRFALHVTRLCGPDMVAQEIEEFGTLTPEGVEFDLGALLGPPMPEGGPEGTPDGTPDGAPAAAAARDGIVTLRLTALGDDAELTGGAFLGRCPDPAPVRLAIAVTTFRREAEVAQTAARITRFLDGWAPLLGAGAHLFVIDNGGSARPAPHPRLTRVDNPNLGGAGGFARGLAEAADAGFTHCLFMDDDAATQMEALIRTLAFLRLARSPKAALAGAMISTARRWAMWENGAVFSGCCRPQFVGTDLRSAGQVIRMELAAARPKPENFYAGWWFFAFPIAAAGHFPFPFFVRGDDISFSLANRFDTATLNGVVSFQEDFSRKESPLTLYLDLRNHLHHHLVQPGLEIGAWGSARVALRFWARSIVRMHYDSAEAQLEAWQDVMAGPGFFAANADMAARRPRIAALARTEAWRAEPVAGIIAPPVDPGPRRGWAMKLVLNGHLLPFFGLFGREVVVPADHRGLIWPLWGARRARFVDAAGSRSYVVTHSKRRFLRLGWRALGLTRRWLRAYPALRAAHRQGYAEMTRRDFWDGRFAAAPPPAAPAVAAPAAPAAAPTRAAG